MSARAIRFLAQMGDGALKPSRLPGGKWASPKVSKRIAANIRKQALLDGTFGTFEAPQGGWLAAWDTPKKPIIRRPLKGHKPDRTRETRFTKIQDKLAEQPKLIELYRQSVKDAKPKPGISTLYKRLVAMKGGSK